MSYEHTTLALLHLFSLADKVDLKLSENLRSLLNCLSDSFAMHIGRKECIRWRNLYYLKTIV